MLQIQKENQKLYWNIKNNFWTLYVIITILFRMKYILKLECLPSIQN